MRKGMLIILLFITFSSAYSIEDFTIWKVDATVQKFNDVYFAGQDDELIMIVCDSILYRMNSVTGDFIDSLYFGKRALSSAITNDGLKVYVSLWDSIVGYDVYDFSKVVHIPKIPLSGRLIDDDMRTAYGDLSVSNSDRYLNCTYDEGNHQLERLSQVLVYDLESNALLHRLDYSKNLVNEINVYSKPTMTPDEKTIILITSVTGIGEVVFYDLINKEFTTRIETKTKLTPQTEFVFLNENEVAITRSALPSVYGFNVLNLTTNVVEDYFNFWSDKVRLSIRSPYKINDNLFLLTLRDHDNSNFRLTFFNKETRDTSQNFYNIQLGARIDIKKDKSTFISYRTGDIYMHDLNKYLALTSAEDIPESNIVISPNPSQNTIRVHTKVEQFISYEIVDMNGIVTLEEKSSSNTISIDISSLSKGVYFIQLTKIDGSTHKAKFVKE
jgi:hypothetical protein